MSATVTKTYDDKKETVVTEISNLYLTSNNLLLFKEILPLPVSCQKNFNEDFFESEILINKPESFQPSKASQTFQYFEK